MNELKGIKVRIEGLVQGVGFRYSTVRKAQALNLKGYVRNLPGGSVEVMAEGEAFTLKELSLWLKKGPPGAYVRRAEIRNIPYTGVYKSFIVEY